MAVTLTIAAAERVKTFLTKDGSNLGLKLGVKTTGCSGLAYVMDFIHTIDTHSVEFNSEGVRVFIHQDDLKYLDGTEIDFIKDGLNESFKYNNPNVTAQCGCGESFSIK